MTDNITLSISSSKGKQRLQLEGTCEATILRNKIRDLLHLGEDFKVHRDNGKGQAQADQIISNGTTTITALGLKHGELLHVHPLSGTIFQEVEGNSLSKSNQIMEEDQVDIDLSKMDGKVEQGRTSSCNHQADGACIHCTPIDPYDAEYRQKEGIKFMSFHSYLKKLDNEKGNLGNATLEEINLSIKPGCTKHLPWPQGLCTACQPPALTLNRQTYRHVDYVTFENKDIVDNFLNYWRLTSYQRAGILYGRYEPFSGVPLGIQAVVAAIYEPPQQSTQDFIKLLPQDEDGKQTQVDRIAKSLGLCRVGWIFTDLIQMNPSGHVEYYRNADNYFLSSQECITAGHFQNMYPNITNRSSTQKYGSKQVTVVVTGDSANQICIEAYQVSQQCMALVRAEVLLPAKDAPELGYVREPKVGPNLDVFYKDKDQYGNEVTKMARPLPIEYLLIDVPSGLSAATTTYSMSLEGDFFNGVDKTPFPIENRPMEGHLQNIKVLANYRKKFGTDIINFFRDFHVLIYLVAQGDVPLVEEDMKPLLEALRDQRVEDIYQWAQGNQWGTLELIMDELVNEFH